MIALSKNTAIKRIVFMMLLVPTMFLLNSFTKNKDKDSGLKIGDEMPLGEQDLFDVSGDTLNLNELKKESGLIVVFSCNTCPFVVGNDDFEGWEKDYNSLYDKANEKGIGFVLINSNEAKRDGADSMDEMIAHSENNQYKMPYVADYNSVMADAFGARTTPHVYMFNEEAELVYMGSIDNTWDSDRKKTSYYLSDAIESLATGKTIKKKSTAPKGCSIKRTKK